MINRWRFERRIPIALLLSVMLQIGGALMWATQLDARVGSLEQRAPDSMGLNEKFARLDERLDFMKQDLSAMKRQLDHITDKLIDR